MNIGIDLYHFLVSIPLAGDGSILQNTFSSDSDTLDYISNFYTPKLEVNTLVTTMLPNLDQYVTVQSSIDLTDKELLYQLNNTDIAHHGGKLYIAIQSLMAETFCYNYALTYNTNLLSNVVRGDILQTIANADYIIDALSSNMEYNALCASVIDLNVALGIIKNQLEVIKSGAN